MKIMRHIRTIQKGTRIRFFHITGCCAAMFVVIVLLLLRQEDFLYLKLCG